MSILKNKRNLSKYEYEHSFDVAYKHVATCMNAVPNRYKKRINTPINKKLNEIYSNIMELRTNYFPADIKSEEFLKLITSAIEGIISLQLEFYSFWNIMDYSDRKKAHWCELFNKDLALLYGLLKKNPLYIPSENVEKRMIYYKREDIEKVKYIKNMSELHKYTHQKIAHAKQLKLDKECDMLYDFVNRAFYSCIEANRIIPTNNKQFKTRSKHISNAISNLKKMEIPMISMFNIMEYSENTLREWSTLFNNTIKCIYGIRKSDNERFGNLK